MTRSNRVKGIVLAGGEGKRLRPLTYYFQKCMIPVGHSQKPLLEYIVRLFRYHHIPDILLLTGYKQEQIANYFNSGERFGVQITHALDDPTLNGTGGALLHASRSGFLDGCDDLLVYYGDILSNVDLTSMLTQHRQRGATATLALSHGFQLSVGVAKVNGNNVVGWMEKPTFEIEVGIGVVILHVSVLDTLIGLSKQYKEIDIMSHLLPRLIGQGEPIHAYSTDAFWYDLGSAERYEKLDNDTIEKHLGYLFDGTMPEPPVDVGGTPTKQWVPSRGDHR